VEQINEITIPKEFTAVLKTDGEAKAFFESLDDGSKRGYCEWVGSVKGRESRKDRASIALVRLQRKQKTLEAKTELVCSASKVGRSDFVRAGAVPETQKAGYL
jgi:hypothetical protein